MRQRIDTDAPAAFAPRVAVAMEEVLDTRRETVSGSASTWILGADVPFVANDDESETLELFAFEL